MKFSVTEENLQNIDMEKKTREFTGHVLLLPFLTQGHINPMLQFAKRLASKGLKTTLATTIFTAKSMHLKLTKVTLKTISDGFDETGPSGASSGEAYQTSLEEVGSRTLAELIKKYDNSCYPITCLVYDSICPWALDVAKDHGLVGASFFTHSCSVTSIFYHVKHGDLVVPVLEPTVSVPGLPLLGQGDLPSPIWNLEENPLALPILLSQFSNVEKADWLLFNSFDKLEREVVTLMAEEWFVSRVGLIGPTTPSMYLDKRVEGDTEYSINLFKPSETYVDWLNTKETGSVIYVSFGSITALGEEQMQELMWGLKQSNKYFFWVVKETEKTKLPKSFTEEMPDKGLLVEWCSQIEVLAHPAIGCFITHCGWNSTIEALSLGVPMVTMPLIWDQMTNAKFAEDIWGFGIRAKMDEKGIAGREEIESCIRVVMDSEKGKEIKRIAYMLSESARDAVDAGGSSDADIDEFVNSVAYN